jgi:hypothetical protein
MSKGSVSRGAGLFAFEAHAIQPGCGVVINTRASARNLFRLGEEDLKFVWWWQRLTLIARR